MELINSSSKSKKYTHLSESERYKIEVYYEEKLTTEEIAIKLNRSRSTIYRELKRGTRIRIGYEYKMKKQYRADVAQRDYVDQSKNKGPGLKIGKDHKFEQYIREKLLKEKFSPDVIIGQIKDQGLIFEGMISTKTLYNYIDAGVFSGITNETLWEKRKRKKKQYRKVARVSRTNRMAKSIEQRSPEINDRSEFGHWEGDCVKGPKGRSTSLLTLTERKSRKEIIMKIDRTSQEEVRKALEKLERQFKSQFEMIFKSITFDNGVEFLDWKSLELSVLDPRRKRTTIYFAHAYAAWERGSNEVQNKMIRRFIPKGTDIHEISETEIKRIEDWINNYPRKKLGYKSANQIVKKFLQINWN